MLKKLLEEKRKAEESIIKYENSLISSMPHQMSDCFIEDIFLAGFDCFENFCLKLYQEKFHVSFYKKLLSYDDDQKITIEQIQKSNIHRFVSSKSETFKKIIVNNIIIGKIHNQNISIHEVEHLIDYLKMSDNNLLDIFHKKLKKFSLKYFSERKLLHKIVDEQPLDFDIKHIYPQIHQEFINLKQDEKDNYFINIIRTKNDFAIYLMDSQFISPPNNQFISTLFSDKTLGYKKEYIKHIHSFEYNKIIFKSCLHQLEKSWSENNHFMEICQFLIDSSPANYQDYSELIQKRKDSHHKEQLTNYLNNLIILEQLEISKEKTTHKPKL